MARLIRATGTRARSDRNAATRSSVAVLSALADDSSAGHWETARDATAVDASFCAAACNSCTRVARCHAACLATARIAAEIRGEARIRLADATEANLGRPANLAIHARARRVTIHRGCIYNRARIEMRCVHVTAVDRRSCVTRDADLKCRL